MSYEIRFEAVDLVTGALVSMNRHFESITDVAGGLVNVTALLPPALRGVGEAATAMDTRLGGALDDATVDARELIRETERLDREITDALDREATTRLSDGLEENQRDMRELGRETDRVDRKLNGLELSGFGVSRMVGTIGVALAGLGLGTVVKDAVVLQSQFEAVEAVLGNTFGDRNMAADYLREVNEIAADTPFGIVELQDSILGLIQGGFTPMKSEIIALGDLAAAKKATFSDMMEGLADAERGQFDRLTQLKIGYSTIGQGAGAKVALDFGNGVKAIVPKTREAIRQAFINAGQADGIKDTMKVVSETTAGMLSNLSDQWDLTKVSMGEAFRPLLVELVPMALELMDDLVDHTALFATWVVQNKVELVNLAGAGIGALQGLANVAGVLAIGWLVYRGAVIGAALGQGIWNVAMGVGKFLSMAYEASQIGVLRGFLAYQFAAARAAVAQWAFNGALAANPIGLIVLGVVVAIAAIAALAYYFDDFRAFLFAWGQMLFDYSPFGWLWYVADYLCPKLTESIGVALQGVMDWFKKTWNWIDENFIQPFSSFLSAFTDVSFSVSADINKTPAEGEDETAQTIDEIAVERRKLTGTPVAPGAGTGAGSVASAIGGMTGSGGSGGPKTINIRVDTLVREIKITAGSVSESAADIERIVGNALLNVLNQANFAG